jgi:hypothetical protein
LEHYLPDYNKGAKGLFEKLLDRLETAKKHAAQSLAAANANSTDNPSTRVHELVAYLQQLKK